MRIGIDVGGTFTDVVVVDDGTGQVHYAKTSTTPGSLADGVLAGIEKGLAVAGKSIDELTYISHGTTIGGMPDRENRRADGPDHHRREHGGGRRG